jgi:hypothetical protein
MAKDCEVANPLRDEVLWAYVFGWGVQAGCWEDD